jgi:hypothetical protein
VFKHKDGIGAFSEILGNGFIVIEKLEVDAVIQIAGFAVIV